MVVGNVSVKTLSGPTRATIRSTSRTLPRWPCVLSHRRRRRQPVRRPRVLDADLARSGADRRALGMTAEEVLAAPRAQNIQVAGGSDRRTADQDQQCLPAVAAVARPTEGAGEFEDIIVKSRRRRPRRRLKDVRPHRARRAQLDGRYQDRDPATVVVLTQQPGSDALKTTKAVYAAMAEIRTSRSRKASNTASATTRPNSSRFRSGS